MKTTCVYVIVCSEEAIYAEQAWCSIFSLKHFNPDARVTIVTDPFTAENFRSSYRRGMLEMVDELKVVEVDSRLSGAYQSRYLKTSLREHITGDFLFIDTDTIVTGDLSDMDQCTDDVAMALDLHCPLPRHPQRQSFVTRQKKFFGYDYDIEQRPNYYNSGVIYAKDTPQAHELFRLWHEAWQQSSATEDMYFDQLPLMKVTHDHPELVHELNGAYNCQIRNSLEFFNRARIMHFFNEVWNKDPVSKFFTKEFYNQIQLQGGLSEDDKVDILNCKDSFTSPSFVIGSEVIDKMYTADEFLNMKWLAFYRSHPFMKKLSDKLLKLAIWNAKRLKRIS